MILAAYNHMRAFIESVYPDLLEQGKILHLDSPARVTELVQGVEQGKAVQLFVPNCVDAASFSNLWRARVMILAPSINDALLLADKLTEALKPNVRRPQAERELRSETQSGPGYGVITVTYTFTKKP